MLAAYAADVPPIHHAPAHEVARLRELARGHKDVTVFSAHDPAEFDALAKG